MKKFLSTWYGKVVLGVFVIVAIFCLSRVFSSGPRKVAAQATTALDTVTAERDLAVAERDKMALENSDLKIEIQDLTAQRDGLQVQVDQAVAEKAEAASNFAALQANFDMLQEKLDAINAEKAAAEAAAQEAAKLAAEAAEAEPFDLIAVYNREHSKMLPATDDRGYAVRGEDWVGGFTFTLEPGQFQVLYSAEGTVSAGDAFYQIEQEEFRENAIVIVNNAQETVEFRLTGFSPSGFGQWPYRLGTVPDVDEVIWANIGHGNYCGSGDDTGCKTAVLHNVSYDGEKFDATTTLWDTPHDIVDNVNPIRTADWASVDLAAGWSVLMENISQPVSKITVKTPDSVLYLGVTNGKDQVLWLPAGATVVQPTGEPIAIEKPSVVILRNRVGHTVVFKITGATTAQLMEFRKGSDPAAAGQFIVNYTAASSDKAMFGASATPTSADAIGLLIVTNE